MTNPPPLQVRMQLDGVNEALKAFRSLPKEASKEIRDASLKIARQLAQDVALAGRQEGAQAALLAGTVKAKYDRIPAIVVGPGARTSRGTPSVVLLIGSEFGHGGQGGRGKGSRKFDPHGFESRQSPRGIWIFPTVRREEGSIGRAWLAAAAEIVRRFSGGAS